MRRSGGALLRQLPKPLAQEIRDLFGVKWVPQQRRRSSEKATDALGLSGGGGGRGRKERGAAKTTVTGRAAAAVGPDPEASSRLERALGEVDLSRAGTGGRAVAGIVAPDVRDALEAAGHRVVAFVPGTAVALAGRAESVVVDLDGFRGVWDGTLDAGGVGLFLELTRALKTAADRGVTCWLLVRGPHRHRIGALALLQSPHVLPLKAGAERERIHFTEDPGDAPYGIADVLTASEEAFRA